MWLFPQVERISLAASSVTDYSDNSLKWLFKLETRLQGTFNYRAVSGSDLDVHSRHFRAWSWSTSAPAAACFLANQWIQWIITLLHSYSPNTAQINCSMPSRAPDRALHCHELNNQLLILNISTDLHSNNPAAVIMLSHILTEQVQIPIIFPSVTLRGRWQNRTCILLQQVLGKLRGRHDTR